MGDQVDPARGAPTGTPISTTTVSGRAATNRSISGTIQPWRCTSRVTTTSDVGRAGGAPLADRIERVVPGIVPVHPAVRTTEVPEDAVLIGAVHVATGSVREIVFDSPT